MVYAILKVLANLAIRIYYRKTFVTGLENIPTDKPVLIACNHPSGFLEPIFLACIWPKPLNFMVRGDLFKQKLLGALMVATNQIPIYRFKDGYASLKKNNESISKATSVLLENKPILIFVEGSTKKDWQLRPIQKGLARIAKQCLDENQGLDLKILPVGITFTKGEKYGTEVMINIGKCFDAKPKLEEAGESFRTFNSTLENEMRSLMIDLKDLADTPKMTNAFHRYFASQPFTFFPRLQHTASPFPILKKESENFGEVQPMMEKSNGHSKSPLGFLALLICLPGLIFHFIPTFLALSISNSKVKSLEFYSSVLTGASMGFYLIWYLLWFVLGCILLGLFKTILLLALLFASGYAFLFYKDWTNATYKNPLK